MSRTEDPNDWGDEAGESEDSQAGAPKPPPTIEELKAAAAAAQESINAADAEIQRAAAAAAAAMTGNHQPNNENQNQHRAKKAQKTKGRVKINVPTNEVQGQQAVAAPKKKPKHQPEPAADGEEEEEEDDEEEEPSRLIPAIVGCFQAIGAFFVKIFQLVGSLFKRVFGLFLGLFKMAWCLICRVVPLLAGVPLYCLILYLSAEYVVTKFDSEQQLDVSCRLNYLLRCHAFTLLPVLLGLVVSSQKAGESHQRFYHEAYEQVVLLIINTLIMTAHCSVDQLHWISCITIGYLLFSLPYWISLSHGGQKLQSTLRSPIIVTNIALMLYNVVILSGQYFGYFVPETIESQSKESAGVDFGTQTSPDDYQDSSGYSWWYFLFPPGLVALFYQNYHLIV